MGSVMKERISQIKAILSDLKDGMLLKEETGDWSSQGAIQMRSCLGKILLLIRAMREKIVEGDEFSDQVRATNAEILSRCYQQIKRLYLVLPLGESAGKINKADHIIFQVNVETVIFQLETVLGEAPIKTLGHINTDKESTEASPLDELNDLRRKLINAEIRRELELIGHKLMLSKERTFVLQARKEQHAAELRLAEEQDRVRKLKKSLSKSKLKLKVISEQNEELMGYQNRWIEQREPKENLQVEQRKCRMSSQGRNCVNKSSRQNQSEQETLKNLKHQLRQSK
uniref:Uncharacterized protein LOC108053598 n=1 Tax=Drosophila rhopaloa TaxID=1041015 RepID=A0A6P4FQI5_DRORH